MKLAVGQFMHETVTFLDRPTTLDDFVYDGSPLRGEELLMSGADTYMGGFVKVAREYPDVELVGLTSPMWPKTATGSGWIENECYEELLDRLLRDLEAQGGVDGVFLALHGAMAVQGVPRPESDIARRVRAVVGSTTFIAATFDPHGNEDEEFLREADFAFCAKYYPHYDEYLQGSRAARALVRACRGDYRPASVTSKIPIVTPTVLQWTGKGAWAELVQRSLVWEARHPDLYVNAFFGFPWSDVPDLGMTIQATANGDLELAAEAARDLSRWAWSMRHQLVEGPRIYSVSDGLTRSGVLAANDRVVVADHSDRSGASTWCLSEVVARGLSRIAIAVVADEGLVRRLEARDVREGDPIDCTVGEGNDPRSGPPVQISGRVARVARPHGLNGAGGNAPWITISFGDRNLLVLAPFLAEVREPHVLSGSMGLDISDTRVFVVKSRVHFRRGFMDSGFAQHALIVEPPGVRVGGTDLRALEYENVDLSHHYPYGRRDYEPKLTPHPPPGAQEKR